MTPERHHEKAERFERSLALCGDADHEARIEGAMLAASHWINFALHALALAPPEKDFQHPYFLTDDERSTYDQALGPELLRAYDEIEDLRPFYVRGADADGATAGRRAIALLGLIRDGALAKSTGARPPAIDSRPRTPARP